MTSREYFDQVRTAVADVRRAEETLDYWESRIDSLGGWVDRIMLRVQGPGQDDRQAVGAMGCEGPG